VLQTGVLLLLREPTPRLAALARAIDDWGYDYLWLADERFFRDVYAALALCAVNTRRLHLGPCVTDPYSRHPALTAVSIATLDEISEGRAVLGLGAGLSGFRELGLKVDRPVVAMREAITVIRGLLAGETVDADGEFVVFQRGRLDFVPPRARIPVLVASQREGGLRLAGRVADAAMMQGCVAEPILEFFRERVREGVARERREPSAIDLVARVNVAIADDPRAAKDSMRPSIVRHLLAESPEFPTFARAGLTLPKGLRERLLAMEYTHDPARVNALAGEVPDSFVDAVTLAGDVTEVAAGVTRLARGGITQFVVYPVAPAGRIEPTLEAFQRDVMPAVRKALA
jgi:5,10-methylenetetrahydromethanopterin reductase